LGVEGITLAIDQGDVLVRSSWDFGSLLPGPCRVFTCRGLGLPGLRCLLLDRLIGDAKLGRLGAMLGGPPVGFLDQGSLTGEHRPHATLMMNEE
jgi:hypothetical protein